MSTLSGSANDTRRKQSKRDEAIRKKIENELSRKRTLSSHGQALRPGRRGKPAPAKGTVAALKPSPALTVPESITVADASQLCAAKRTDCVLVVDDDEGLSGIFTAKDMAYRVTAEGLDPRTTPVSAIMTRNPMVTRDTTSATEALELMVTRGFRHLPVCNEEGNVMGLLDITKVFHEALEKVERGSSASQKLYSALEGVQSELGNGFAANNPQAAAMLQYVQALRDQTALPDLTTVMHDERTQPATVGPKTTVKEAAKLMKERRTTAVCVMEGADSRSSAVGVAGTPRIAGIFTSKDVVLRVIAAGLEPGRCSVVRVMTPHPDTALPTMTIQDALKKMHNGHYLNLPVVESDGRLVAIVDVLKLTYATLEQMNNISGDVAGQTAEAPSGPMWSHFFNSLANQEDNESVLSGSHIPTDLMQPFPSSPSHVRQGTPYSEIQPHDSASGVGEPVDFPPLPVSTVGDSVHGASAAPAPVPVDDGTYVFKFRTPSGRTHRFQARNDNYDNLIDIVAGKLATDPFFTEHTGTIPEDGVPAALPDSSDFVLSYTDSDGDTVLITSDSDVADAVRIARNSGSDRVVLFLQGGKGWDAAGAGHSEEKAQEASAKAKAVEKEVEQVEKANEAYPEAGPGEGKGIVAPPPTHLHNPPVGGTAGKGKGPGASAGSTGDGLFGVIPRDMVLPASMGFLGVVIVGVFIASRMSREY